MKNNMKNNIKYVHTNLIARDWKKLANFYIDVLNCEPVPPERNLSGEWIDTLTGIPNVHVNGMHLSLPGIENGPTLEIFQYEPADETDGNGLIHRKGFAHIAFHVDSVEEVLSKIVEQGGGQLSEIVRKEYEDIGHLTVVYATDPEGNFIEIQNWRMK